MLDILKSSLLITKPATLKLQSLFDTTTPETMPHWQQSINEVIQSIYGYKTHAKIHSDDLVPLFFIIPKTIEALSDENHLKFFRCIIYPLVEQLPWVKRALKLNFQEQTIAEQQLAIDNYIEQYGKYCDEVSGDLLKKFFFTHDMVLHADPLSYTCINTIIAYTSLEIIRSMVLEKFPEEHTLLAQLDRSTKVCDLFLSSKSLTMNLEEQYQVLGAITNIFLFQGDGGPVVEAPSYLTQIQAQFKEITQYKIIKHCLLLKTIDFGLETSTQYIQLEALIILLANDLDKPLIHILNFNPQMILYMTQHIFNDFREPHLIAAKLTLLLNGLKPSSDTPSNHEALARFRFLRFLYRDYVEANRGKYPREGVMILLINTLLEEERLPSDPCIQTFKQLAFTSDHIGFTLAFCLSNIHTISTTKKKELFTHLMKTADPSIGTYLNWLKMTQNPTLPKEVGLDLFKLFMCYTDDRCFYNDTKLHQVLSYFSLLLTEYWKINSKKTADFILEKVILEIKITHFSNSLIGVIDRAKDGRLLSLITTMLSCHESTTHLLLLLLITSAPLSGIFTELFVREKEAGAEADKSSTIYCEENFLDKITFELCKLDLEKLSPRIIEALLSKDQAALKDNPTLKSIILLLLLALVSRNTSAGIIPKQAIWFKWTLSLIKEVTINHPQTEIGKHMFNFIKSLSFEAFLPKEKKIVFLDTIHPKAPMQPMASVDEILAELEDKPTKKTPKKQKKKPAKKPIDLSSPAHEINPPTDVPQDVGLPCDIAEAAKKEVVAIPENPPLLVEPPLEKPKKITLVKDIGVSHDISKKPIDREIPSALHKLQNSMPSSLKKINEQLTKISTLELPAGFAQVYKTVQQSMTSIQTTLLAPLFLLAPPSTGDEKVNYSSLSPIEKLTLEEEWNKELAVFCWDVQIKLEKYLEATPEEYAIEHQQIIETIKGELIRLNHCYFKNPTLHFDEAIIRCLTVIKKHYQSQETRVAMKGNFAFPKEAADLDLIIIPEKSMKQHETRDKFTAWYKEYGDAIISGQIFQNETLLSHHVDIMIPSEAEINIDLNFLKNPLSPTEELEITARAFLSTCAIHWYLDGHACMQAQTARAICCDKPVLKLLVPLKTIEEYINLSGYFLKNIIKYGDMLRHDHHIKQFIIDYINPETRYTALPTTSANDIEKNQQIITSALDYLLNRLSSRTAKTIHFIIEKQLLLVIFPLHKELYPVCSDYFSKHFFPIGPVNCPSNLSGPAFLSMFFIGSLIDQPQELQLRVIEALKKSLVNYQKIFKEMLNKTLLILEPLMPLTTDKLSMRCESPLACGKKLSFETESLKTIWGAWHPEPPLHKKPTSPSIKPVDSREKTPSPTSPVKMVSTAQPPPFFSPKKADPQRPNTPIASTKLGSRQ